MAKCRNPRCRKFCGSKPVDRCPNCPPELENFGAGIGAQGFLSSLSVQETSTHPSSGGIDAMHAALLQSQEAEQSNSEEPEVHRRLAEGQLPMFMTAKEVLDRYRPAEGDRLYWYENGRGTPDHEETDQELWERKLREAKGETRRHKFPPWGAEERPPAPSKESPGFLHPNAEPEYTSDRHPSLFDAVKEEGVVAPISLQTDQEAGGRPQVLGGHHRVATMNDLDPEALFPVSFHDSMKDAKESLGESY